MADLNYTHPMNGTGIGAGLPLMPGSELYNVQPMIKYPLFLSTGITSETDQYTTYLSLRTPHEMIVGDIPPYISNPNAPGTGTFTRYQFFVMKRGHAVMVTERDLDTVGVLAKVSGAAEVQARKYADQREFARPSVSGYQKDNDAPITLDAWQALPADEQDGFRPVYKNQTDTNDPIVTGGEDFAATVEEAIMGRTTQPRFVSTDIRGYYGSAGLSFDGFMRRSSGGFDRIDFFTPRDQAAGVVLPTNGVDVDRTVIPLSTADVSSANIDAWKNSAVYVNAAPTVGVSHTDLEQTLNLKYWNFRTGMEPRGFVSKGRMLIPFVNLERLNAILDARMKDPDFAALNFTDQTGGRSGAKVGVVQAAKSLDVTAKYSVLTGRDSGYSHLLHRFWAPFAVFTKAPRINDTIVPDLHGNYTGFGTGALAAGATAGAGNAFALDAAGVTANKDGVMTANAAHKLGYIRNVRTIEKHSIIDQVVNPLFQVRTPHGIQRQIDHGYNRVTGADTQGIAPMLTDFAYMVLGGSNRAWAGALMPSYDGARKDLSYVIEDLIYERALGVLEVVLDASIAR